MMVSPENWQVGKNDNFEFGTHNGKPMTDVRKDIVALGFKYFPMLTSGNIQDLRKLWASPTKFIEESIAMAKNNSYYGYHIDFEPESGVVVGDAKLYSEFLNLYSNELHKSGLILSVDVARWSPMWDFGMLAKTSVDKVCSMQSYTTDLARFEREVSYTMTTLKEKGVVGMMSNMRG